MRPFVAAVLALTALSCSDGPRRPPPAPLAPLIPCNPEVCDPPRSCHPIDGVDLCVLTCNGGVPCDPDEFPLTISGTATCACVPQRPGGRTCNADVDCAWGPDATGPEHLCVSHGGARACQPLGVSCRGPGDCGAGFVCDPSRVCTKDVAPPPPPLVYRRDADGDGLCTSESVAAPAPGPGAGWRTDCTADERPICDDYRTFTCAPGDTEAVGVVVTGGTSINPYLGLQATDGRRYSFVGPMWDVLRKYANAQRFRVTGRVIGADATGGVRLEVNGWWLEIMNSVDVPEIGRLRLEGGEYYLHTATAKLHLTTRTASVRDRLPAAVDWKVYVIGKTEGADYRIWQLRPLYKPDVP